MFGWLGWSNNIRIFIDFVQFRPYQLLLYGRNSFIFKSFLFFSVRNVHKQIEIQKNELNSLGRGLDEISINMKKKVLNHISRVKITTHDAYGWMPQSDI